MSKIKSLIPDKLYISLQYFKHFKKFPNLKNPKTFNEKLQWLKLHNRQDAYTVMVDKHLVKKICIEYHWGGIYNSYIRHLEFCK